MNLEELRTKYRGQILEIAEECGVENVRVFGSVVRGDAKPESDIDFVVTVKSGKSLLDLGGLHYRLEELLGCDVDIVPENWVKSYKTGFNFQEAVPI